MGVTKYWRYSREKMNALIAEGRIMKTAGNTVRFKRYLDEMPGIPLQNMWDGHQRGRRGAGPLRRRETTVVAAERLKRAWLECAGREGD